MAEEQLPVFEVEEGLELEAGSLEEGGGVSVVVAGSNSGQVGSSGKVVLVKKVAPAWDPQCSPDWDKESHSKEALLRIKRDLHTIYSDPPFGICVIPSGDDLTRLDAIITGPFDTPYEGGLFHFVIRFPPNYPLKSPRVKFMTTGGGVVRFNPNLYQNGKVCLSILGTWKGPAWSAVQSLQSVLMSIQTLLNERPYHNEPGFHQEHHPGESNNYNNVIIHETLRVAVCDALERNQCPDQLLEVKKTSFVEFYDYYIRTAQKLSPTLDGQAMQDPFGFNKGRFDFRKLIKRLQTLHDQLTK